MSTVAKIETAAAALFPDDFGLLMKDLIDLKLARERLAEIEAGAETTTLDELKKPRPVRYRVNIDSAFTPCPRFSILLDLPSFCWHESPGN